MKSRFSNFSFNYEANAVGRIPYRITANTIRKVASLDPTLQIAECELPYDSVDLLIGAKYANVILTGEKKFFDGFSLQSSTFGWITEGPLSVAPTLDAKCCQLTVKVEDDLARFFEVEEVAAPTPAQSEHERCEVQVRLPRDKPLCSLANTYAQARASLLKFEQKLDVETRSMYVDFMREYRKLNHMRLAVNLDVPRFFIPHLFVMRPDSSST